MNRENILHLFLISLLLTNLIFAQKHELKHGADIEIGSLIVDETQTKLGHDFYDQFFSNWPSPEGNTNYTIIISEKPIPGTGTQVTVTLNDLNIYQRILQPRFDVIEASAIEAVNITFQFLQNYEAIVKELEGEDLKGTGIY